MKLICKNAEAIIVVSPQLRDDMLKCGLTNYFYIVPNVVEIPNELPEIRKQQKKIFLTVADMDDEKKNISGIICAANAIYSLKNNFEFHIIGGGKDEEKLKSLSGNL